MWWPSAISLSGAGLASGLADHHSYHPLGAPRVTYADLDARLLQQQMLDVYRTIAPEHSRSAEILVQRLASELYARGVRVSIGADRPPEEKVIHHSLDADRRIVWVCKLWNQIMGFRSRGAIGKPITNYLAPHEQGPFEDRWLCLLRDGKVGPFDFTMLTVGGTPLAARGKSEILRDSEGLFVRTFAKITVFLPRVAMLAFAIW
jgi:hypothetical protein